MIKSDNICKYFDSLRALEKVSFEIGQGEIVGFLGQNGAGKTTLMRILTGYFGPTSGRALIAGMDVQKQPMAARRKIGYLPETPPLYTSMTVKDYLKLAARLKDVPFYDEKRRIGKALEDCMLTGVQGRIIGQLSKGYRQRVGLAQAIINDPDVLILDEPTSGLDPVQNSQIRGLIKGLEEKRTVLLSTHHLAEIEHLVKRVIIIKDGKVAADDTLANLTKGAGATRKVKVCVRGDREKIYQVINAMDGPDLLACESRDGCHDLTLEFKTHMEHYNALVEKITGTGGKIISLEDIRPGLEDVFFDIVAKGGEAP